MSFGQRGYHVTVGHGHVRQTVGIPGTGLSWTTVSGGGRQQRRQVSQRAVRRAPPQAARPQMTPQQSRHTAITCLLVIFVLGTAGLGLIPIAIWGLVRRRRRKQEPDSLARQLIEQARATPDPAAAVGLLHSALDTDPSGPNTLVMCADWFYEHQCWADAADAYAGYFHIASSASAEIKLAVALTGAGHLAEALSELQQLLNRGLGESDHDYVLSQLALVFMLKGDPNQGLAFANQANLRKRDLTAGAQRSLLMRASCRYQLGQKAKAREDLDRLYAIGTSAAVLEIKNRMVAETFVLDTPMPYPDWYPRSVHVLEGPEMEEVPDEHGDALANGDLSPDGRWLWTGSEWAAVDQAPSLAAESAPPVRTDRADHAAAAVGNEGDQVSSFDAASAQAAFTDDPAPAAGRDDVLTQSEPIVWPTDDYPVTAPQPTAIPIPESNVAASASPTSAVAPEPDAAAQAKPEPPPAEAIEVPSDIAPDASPIRLQSGGADSTQSFQAEAELHASPQAAPSPKAAAPPTPSLDLPYTAEPPEMAAGTTGLLSASNSGDLETLFSPDGAWWWNGSSWIPAFSDDQRWHWSGTEWQPTTKDPG